MGLEIDLRLDVEIEDVGGGTVRMGTVCIVRGTSEGQMPKLPWCTLDHGHGVLPGSQQDLS